MRLPILKHPLLTFHLHRIPHFNLRLPLEILYSRLRLLLLEIQEDIECQGQEVFTMNQLEDIL
jgi:hypothetical protein